MQGCLLVDSHKSTGSGPVRSPASCPCKKPKNHHCSNLIFGVMRRASCLKQLTRFHTAKNGIARIFFFFEFGRCRTVARSLHEHKQSKRYLYKDPQPDLRFRQSKNSKPNTQRGKSPNNNTHKKDLPRDTALKNMPKLIIHHDIQ